MARNRLAVVGAEAWTPAPHALRALGRGAFALLLVLIGACTAQADPPVVVQIAPNAPVALQAERAEAPWLGVNFRHLDDERALGLAHEAGIQFVRTDLFWYEVERDKRYDFTEYDANLNNLDRHGLRALLILDYLHPDHVQGRLDTPQEIAAFAHFANVAATHFRGRNVVWEVWNEPNVRDNDHCLSPETFARLTRAAADEVHAAEPQARVVSGGLSWVEHPYARGIAGEWGGRTPTIVGFGIHPYRDAPPEGAVDDLAALSLALRERGVHLPLWDTEWGYSSAALPDARSTDGHNDLNRRRQAALAARQMLTMWRAGVEASVWYELRDEGEDAHDDGDNFGLLDSNDVPKPAYLALRTFVHETAGAHLIGSLANLPNGISGLRFQSPRGELDVLWVDAPGGRMRVAAQGAVALDMFGTSISNLAVTTISEADGPIYLEWRR